MTYLITHKTTYDYDMPVSLCQNIAVLKPRDTAFQKMIKAELSITPHPTSITEYKDFFDNYTTYFSIEEEHKILSVTSTLIVENNFPQSITAPLFNVQPWEEALLNKEMQDISIKQYTYATPITSASPKINEYALNSFPSGRTLYDGVLDLMHRIYNDFTFKSGYTTIATPPAEVLLLKFGVCQDFAHLAIACLRSLGIPARYVSGYIETIPPDGKEKLVGSDASHAWFAVYIPESGWIDFDPTNNQIPNGQHITISWGRDYFDIVPLKGVILGSGENTMEVSVDVTRIG